MSAHTPLYRVINPNFAIHVSVPAALMSQETPLATNSANTPGVSSACLRQIWVGFRAWGLGVGLLAPLLQAQGRFESGLGLGVWGLGFGG